jgi:hypothetical protein
MRSGEEKTATRSSRYRRPPPLGSVAEKGKDKERVGFDRGAVPPLAVVNGVLAQATVLGNADSEQEQVPGEDADVLSREVIKASSRSKLAQRKRGSSNSVGDVEHHDG